MGDFTMIAKNLIFRLLQVIAMNMLFEVTLFSQVQRDLVNGNLVLFNENGAWCWFQDERVVIDTLNGKMIIGSVSNGMGVGNTDMNYRTNVETVIFDLQTGFSDMYILKKEVGGDDHNAPAVFVYPDGKYLAMYALHRDEQSHYFRFDGMNWGQEQNFIWNDEAPIPLGEYLACYSNLWYLSSEGRTYNFVRSVMRSPNMMISDDNGISWRYGGMLTKPTENIGYVNGYFKYWGNGIDRIDFITTESHPRDFNNNIYHGYVTGGKSYKSDGSLMDNDITDTIAPRSYDFTRIFSDSTIINGDTMRRCWDADVHRYDDGTIAAIITTRANNNIGGHVLVNNQDLRFIYCRYNGINWTYSYLCKAGANLRRSEQDYSGLGALNPNDPNTLYISTTYDPRDDSTFLHVHEIFEGTTTDNGVSWNWSPVTQNSTHHNVRPVAPIWNKNNTALLWLRGMEVAAGDEAIVGILNRKSDSGELQTYIDATPSNTTMANGSPLIFTGPGPGAGLKDNIWHIRTGHGNDGTIFSSSEIGGENVQVLQTQIPVSAAGQCDVWINFWADPDDDWRIKAGLESENLKFFRQRACKQVEAGDHAESITLTDTGNIALYQGYLGRININMDDTIKVYTDDEAIPAWFTTPAGDTVRTWYDGISYAFLVHLNISDKTLVLSDTAHSISSFDINSNTNWTIVNPETWLTIDPSSGSDSAKVLVTGEENTNDSARMANITITAAGINPQQVIIYQTVKNPDLTLSDTIINMNGSAVGTENFDISSNCVWYITSSQDWLTANNGVGINNGTIILTASLNPYSEKREATITVSAIGPEQKIIRVIQEGNPYLMVSDTLLYMNDSAGSTTSFAIISNFQWNVSSLSEWLSINPLTGVNNEIITLTGEKNPYDITRNAVVAISSFDISPPVIKEVLIVQAADTFTSIHETGIELLSIYPVPVKNNLFIKNTDAHTIVSLYTFEGKLLTSLNNCNSAIIELDLTNYKPGMYLLKVLTYGEYITRKIIKE